MAQGCVFDIQRFSVHDGPGIRTTVFFKGCSLRCVWCHNPESIEPKRQLQFYPLKCIGCGRCIASCPEQAIQAAAEGLTFMRDMCVNCCRCVESCFASARVIAGKAMSVDEVMDTIGKDTAFYNRSGGGVTFSGGEPILQIDFLIELLDACRNQGIHTAVDTAGNVPWDALERVAAHADLILYDIKMMNEVLHKQYTGTGNARIMDNLRCLADGRVDVIIRIPVLPGINDTMINMQQTADFLQGLSGIQRVELLPFHRLGEVKYRSLGIPYDAETWRMPEKAEMTALAVPFEKAGIPVKPNSAKR